MSYKISDEISRVAVIAPAGTVFREKVEAGKLLLEQHGIGVTIMPNVFAGGDAEYLSASLEKRLADLHAALQDQSIDAIWCARGGFGTAHLLPHIDWTLLRERNLPIIGYSDITALHLAMLRTAAGIPITAPMAAKLTEAIGMLPGQRYTGIYLRHALGHSTEPIPADPPPGNKSLTVIKPGATSGLPVPANLAVMTSLCGTTYFPDFTGKILLLEDLNEPLYKIDRYLTQLEQNGVFQQCAGVIFGKFIDCGEEEQLRRLLLRFAHAIPCPILANFPFGHSFPFISIRQDRPMSITTDGAVML